MLLRFWKDEQKLAMYAKPVIVRTSKSLYNNVPFHSFLTTADDAGW